MAQTEKPANCEGDGAKAMSIIKSFEGRVSGIVEVSASDARNVVACSPNFCDNDGEAFEINGIPYKLHLSYKWQEEGGGWPEGWRLDHQGVTRMDLNGGFGSYGTMTDAALAAMRADGVIGKAVVGAAAELVSHGALWAAEGASIQSRRERVAEQIEKLTAKAERLRLAQLDAEARAEGDSPQHVGAYRCKCERYKNGAEKYPGDEVGPGADYSHDVRNCAACAGSI